MSGETISPSKVGNFGLEGNLIFFGLGFLIFGILDGSRVVNEIFQVTGFISTLGFVQLQSSVSVSATFFSGYL